MIIYLARNKKNGKAYVGKTVEDNFNRRLWGHLRSRYYFGNALRKYGRRNFTFSIVDRAGTLKQLGRKEKHWIKKLNTMHPCGYNLTSGGEKENSHTKSLLTRKNMSKSRKAFLRAYPEAMEIWRQKLIGHKTSKATRGKISKTLKIYFKTHDVWSKGKKLGPSWIKGRTKENDPRVAAIAEAKRGKPRPDMYGKNNPAYKWARLPGYTNPMQGRKRPDLAARNRASAGRKLSAETRAKMSASHKANPITEEHRAAINKALRARTRRLQKLKQAA